MKKYTIKNYKGNLLESVQKFQAKHNKLKIIEAIEGADGLAIAAEPLHDPSPTPDSTSATDSTVVAANDPIIDFGCRLLFFSVLVHLWHLNCTVNSQHLALKELYEACDDTADSILEAEIGITGLPIDKCGGLSDLSQYDLSFNEGSLDQISNIVSEAEALSKQTDRNGISNALDDFCQTCDSVLYKLKRLA